MTYHFKTRTNSKRKILVSFCILLVVFVLFRLVFPITWSYLAIVSSRPFLSIERTLHLGGNNLVNSAEVINLKKQLEDARVALNDRNVLAKENETLREMLGRKGDRNSVLAVVLSKPTFTPYDTFLIDVGADQGIQLNSVVLAGSSTAIGVVSEVYPHMSKVTGYSSPDTKHTVFIGSKNIQADAIGQGNGNFKISLPQGSDIKMGDSIILPDIFPTVFGTVEKIVPGNQSTFINVLFQLPVNLSELYYVEVVT